MLGSTLRRLEWVSAHGGTQCTRMGIFSDTVMGRTVVDRFRCGARK